MKANPAINCSNFSILLAKSTKRATTTLLSTTFRRPGTLVGVSDCSHKLGSFAPCRKNFGTAGSRVGITTPAILMICLPKQLGNFSTRDHGFMSPAPLLMSLKWQTFAGLARKKKLTGKWDNIQTLQHHH